jgi:acetyl-CoA C-acetyltransferase
VAFPYTKYMNAMNTVNQSAAVLMTSVGRARALGIPSERLVYLHGCADAHDHFYVLERVSYAISPAIRCVGREALRMAEASIEDIALFDLYSCFPSAVQIARDMLGIAQDDARPLTVTGGLPYHGGAGNDFTMHAIATMATRLRAQPGALGLVTGNGYYLTVHSAGIYGSEPPRASTRDEPWRRRDPLEYQAELDAEPHPIVAAEPSGPARIETYTVVYDREGAPSQGIVIGRLDDERRFVAHTPSDRGLLEGLTTRDVLGLRGRAEPGERVNRFTPE